jgi:hypothetical protein
MEDDVYDEVSIDSHQARMARLRAITAEWHAVESRDWDVWEQEVAGYQDWLSLLDGPR